MTTDGWFNDLSEDFEESVRIDRERHDDEDLDPRRSAIDSYHVTADSRRFVEDFLDRTLGESEDMRTGSNYWLYGYYGSGKSHLLTVLDGLMDTEWLRGRQGEVWEDFVPENEDGSEDGNAFDELHTSWTRVHDEYLVIPVSINLLKYQGQKQESFSEIILRHAHQDSTLTGIDDGISKGLSPQLGVAYFEDWYRTTDDWSERQNRAADAVEEITPPSPKYDWREEEIWTDIQRYEALAEVVLPSLFKRVTGTYDGYSDLQPSDIDPEEAVSRLEELRAAREEELDEEVKLVLLLDEVSLFIGTNFERLTELQTLAENVDEVGSGDIQLVATAQAKIEDVRPKFAAHGADFSIVKDRFPHRYQLPSKHVGEIAKRRLLRKSETVEESVHRVLDRADVGPSESLVYNEEEIKQNTEPPLNKIDEEELVDFYPFLPYHPPLFLEILFNLRQKARDPAKSIFSGTARAILALMHELLWEWIEEGEEDRIVTLVDFYELIKPELREVLDDDMRVIEGSENSEDDAVVGVADEVQDEDSLINDFDLDVAKAVLLLRQADDTVQMSDGNIAVAVMSDLNGRSWISTKNRVEESLDRLQKFIRPEEGESGARYRFATQDERLVYADTEKNENDPDWRAILESVDEDIWEEVSERLSLPESVPYGNSGDEYPVAYSFSVDGFDFGTKLEREGGLDVHIEVQGLRPETESEQTDEETLYWEMDTDGLEELRERLEEWWALRAAVEGREPPPAVEADLKRRAETARSKLVGAMSGSSSSYTVKDRTDISGISKAVREAVEVGYPDDFHPMMLQVNEDRLRELSELDADDPLPGWAHTIQVPSSDRTSESGETSIQNNVLALTGRQLRDEGGSLNLDTVLDGIVDEKPYYDDVRPAVRAILWGFCREGRLLPVDEDGNALENDAVLARDSPSTTRLRLLDAPHIGKILEEHGFKDTTETDTEGIINLRSANEEIRSSVSSLHEDVRLVIEEETNSEAVSNLLESLAKELSERVEATDERLSVVKDQADGLEDAIGRTKEAQDWFEEVSDVWNRRLSTIRRWDAQITLGDGEFEWIDEDACSAVEERRGKISGFDGEWWETDGWGNLVESLEGDPTTELERSWKSFTEEQDLRELAERVESHPWVVPPTDLPSGVHTAFQRRFIKPLRDFDKWYRTVDEAVASLSEGDGGDSLTDGFGDLEPFSEAVDVEIEELEPRLDRLSSAVGNRSMDEIEQIGVLPDDRQGLDDKIERLVERRDVDVETTDEGVVLR